MHSLAAAESAANPIAAPMGQRWCEIARPEQLLPEGDYHTWLLMAGRGFGKTRAGAEATNELAEDNPGWRFALVGRSTGDVRDVMVEGTSGLCSVNPAVVYEPSKRRLSWPNGCIATTFSSDVPDQLRGPQFHAAWCDEIAAWSYIEDVWDNLQLGLRLGQSPFAILTTTPRPIPLLRELVKDEGCVVTTGSTLDNADNLAPTFINAIKERYEGTRLWAQEVEARILDDAKGALWSRAQLDRLRVNATPSLRRVVVAIDPAVSNKASSDETGIVAIGLGSDGHAYVIDDISGHYSPDGWAVAALDAYDRHGASSVIAEVNNGGDMVEHVLRTKRPGLPYRAIRASRGKRARAEPVVALYEQSRVHHWTGARLGELEDQQCSWDATDGSSSPDRVDALVWGITELMHTTPVGVYTDGKRRRKGLPRRRM